MVLSNTVPDAVVFLLAKLQGGVSIAASAKTLYRVNFHGSR